MKKVFKLEDLDCAHCAKKMEDGIAKIDGNLVDVVTEGDFIDAGSPIVVLRVVGGRNIVRKRD